MERDDEAEKYLIDKIKNDSSMPELAKAACMSNVRICGIECDFSEVKMEWFARRVE